jgi:hypothetical protein
MTNSPVPPKDRGNGAAAPDPEQPAGSVPKRAKAVGGLQIATPIPGAVVSPEERKRAADWLKLAFPNLDPNEIRRNDKPLPEEDSNISIEAAPKKKIKLDDLLASALVEIGYERVAKLVYRARWSTPEIEHMLRFDTFGTPKINLEGDPGMRNAAAEAFARRCQRLYTTGLMQQGVDIDQWWCPIHFSLGAYCGWPGRSCLNTLEYTPDALARKVVDDTRTKLIPLVGAIKTSADFLEFLEKSNWTTPPLLLVGGFYRAAQIAFLARKLGVAREETRKVLLGFSLDISNATRATRFTPETYIDQILDDAAFATLSQQTGASGAFDPPTSP